MRYLTLALLLAIPAPASLLAQSVDPSGHWEGTVDAPKMAVIIEIDLAKNGGGDFDGTFGTPAQNLKGLRLSAIAVEGRSISFQVAGTPGERAFKGALAADGESISGDYTQAGYSMPFRLTRSGAARIDPLPGNAAVGKALEGTWRGTLDLNGVQRTFVLTVSNRLDGTALGTMLNVEEGLEIPVATIVQKGSEVSLSMAAVGVSYSGSLNADGTELAGTVSQGPAAAPLTFRRAEGTPAAR
jgi:hypothetical protein